MRAKFTLVAFAIVAVAATSNIAAAQDPIYCHGCMRRSSDDARYQAMGERLQRHSERVAQQVARSAQRMSRDMATRISDHVADATRGSGWDRATDGESLRTVYHWDANADRDTERAHRRAERALERAGDRTARALERAQRARERAYERSRWYR